MIISNNKTGLPQGVTLTGESADVILEKTLGLARLGHEPGEGSLHVSPLRCSLLSQDLVVRHRFTVRLEQQRHQAEPMPPSISSGPVLLQLCPSENTTC